LALAYTAAGFAETLRTSPYSKAFTLSQLGEYGQAHIRNNDKYTREMFDLMAKAEDIRE
jgi:hypothetical protein